jgi:hypothetical protein
LLNPHNVRERELFVSRKLASAGSAMCGGTDSVLRLKTRTAKVELRKSCCNRLCKNPKRIVKLTINDEVMAYATDMAGHDFWHSSWGTTPTSGLRHAY